MRNRHSWPTKKHPAGAPKDHPVGRAGHLAGPQALLVGRVDHLVDLEEHRAKKRSGLADNSHAG